MEAQIDSIDVSQLKAFALELDQDVSRTHSHEHERDLPLSSATLKDHFRRPGTKNTGAYFEKSSFSTHRDRWPSSAPKPRQPGPRVQAAFQPELPSTIPDSYRSKMLSDDGPSQGDTQRISQSVYDHYYTKNRDLRSKGAAFNGNKSEDEGNALHSVQQGETGHIDLLAAFKQPSIQNDDDDADELDPLSQDIRADLFPESRRFQAPKTPASQGRKRKRGAEADSQERVTPQLPVNPFAGQLGSIDGIMGATQLFQATQAATSPMTNMIPSDGLSERPSPDVHNLQRPSTALSLSSPARMPLMNSARAVTEPQTSYISMKESQEARERLLLARKTEQILSPGELSDDDFAEDTQLRRRLRHKRFTEDARKQFAAVTARSKNISPRSESRRGRPTKHRLTNSSPRKSGRQVSEPVLISDDAPPEDVEGNVTEDETEREDSIINDVDDDVDELAEDNKENVEVPRTVSRTHHTSQIVSSQPTPSHRPTQRPNAVLESKNKSRVNCGLQKTASKEVLRAVDNGTQVDAIADSQSSQHKTQIKQYPRRSGMRAVSEPRSSLESRVLVPHSQSSESSRFIGASRMVSEGKVVNCSSQSVPTRSPNLSASDDLDEQACSTTKGNETTISSLLPRSGSKGPSNPTDSPLKFGHHADTPTSTPVPAQTTAVNTSSNADRHQSNQGLENSIPNSSNVMPSPRTTPKSASKGASNLIVPEQSHASTVFETAPENMSNSPSKSYPQPLFGKSPNKQSSPKEVKRLRTIGEIAADPSPPDNIGDVDVDMNILSNEDIEFQNVVHGNSSAASSRKRPPESRGMPGQAAEPRSTGLPQLPRSPLPPPSSAVSTITPVQSSSPIHAKSSTVGKTSARAEAKENVELSRTVTVTIPRQNPDSNHRVTPQQDQRSKVTNLSKPSLVNTKAPQLPEPNDDAHALQSGLTACLEAQLTAPNRVFAHFNGSNPAYHPATCLEVLGGDEPRYSVRFDDGTVDTISAYGIKKLELKAGDIIKVDIPGARTKNYVVEGMRDQQRPATSPDPETPSRRGRNHSINNSAFPETDTYGFATVLASAKQRASMGDYQAERSQIAVPLTQIYLTQTLWTAFKNRHYVHLPNRLPMLTSLQTPSERPSTPSTPSSRTRRIRASGLPQSRSMTAGTHAIDRLFKNMRFAVTNVDRSDDSKRVKGQIVAYGGVILETGFDELFNIPALARSASPKESGKFQLTSEAQDVGFTCLIADKHCRRAKFVQALSLGIPCLATRWISDCISKQRILPWAAYLLPSGESAFLGGAVRSRNLQPFMADTSPLIEIVDKRPRLLDGASVLLIMEKGQESTMKQHPLITYALGASKIVRAVSEDAAAKAVADAQALGEPWDWVFSYDREKEVEKRLFGDSSTGKKRKSGRNSGIRDRSENAVKTRVVGNEFVIQSLILGMLIED